MNDQSAAGSKAGVEAERLVAAVLSWVRNTIDTANIGHADRPAEQLSECMVCPVCTIMRQIRTEPQLAEHWGKQAKHWVELTTDLLRGLFATPAPSPPGSQPMSSPESESPQRPKAEPIQHIPLSE